MSEKKSISKRVRDKSDIFPGSVIGSLTVLAKSNLQHKETTWECKCVCGKEKLVSQEKLLCKKTRRCSCCRGKGMFMPRERITYDSMIARTSNPKADWSKRYFHRGIRVCQRWRESFSAFLEDMGPKPTPFHTLERLDGNSHYCKENCVWATKKQQARNRTTTRMISAFGESKSLIEWSESTGISRSVIARRLARGLSAEFALSLSGRKKAS